MAKKSHKHPIGKPLPKLQRKLSPEVLNKINSLRIEREEIIYDKKTPDVISIEADKIDKDKMAVEILTWVTKNVENFISNQTKVFKLDLILDNESKTVCDMEESKKMQDLYRAIPDPEVEQSVDKKDMEDIIKVRKKLDKITENVLEKIRNNEEMMSNLFKRMVYYYELKGFNKGKMLLQELEGKVSVLKFEYEAFSVGVKIRNPKESNVIKEYVIPEGFTIWLEIAFNKVAPPVSMF